MPTAEPWGRPLREPPWVRPGRLQRVLALCAVAAVRLVGRLLALIPGWVGRCARAWLLKPFRTRWVWVVARIVGFVCGTVGWVAVMRATSRHCATFLCCSLMLSRVMLASNNREP